MCLGDDDAPAQVQQQSVSNEPPAFLQGPLERFVERAEDQSQNPLQFFPGQTFTDLSQQSEAGLQLATDRALAGSPTLGAANTQLQQTLQGDFLQNPFQDDLTQSILGAVQPSINSQFQRAGRAGSPASANALTTAITDRLAPLAFQNFQNERGNQLQAAQLAPGIAATDFADADVLRQIGGVREGQTQLGLNEQISRFNFNQTEPRERLNLLGTQLQGGNFGGFSTSSGTTTGPSSNNFSNIAGAGLSGLGLLGLLLGT